jgi:hypothetical protein
MEFLEGFVPEKPRDVMYIHQLPFDKLITTKEVLMNNQGIIFTGPDRKFDLTEETFRIELWKAWQKDVQLAANAASKYKVPKSAMDYFQATKHLSKPPRKGDKNIQGTGAIDETLIIRIAELSIPVVAGVLADAVNPAQAANEPATAITPTIAAEIIQENVQLIPSAAGFVPPKFSWSYTALNDFEICPLKCAESRYYKSVKFVETPECLDGNIKHKGLELYLKGKGMDPVVQPYAKYADAMIAAAQGGELLVEQELTLNEGLAMTSWFAKDAWGRAKLDVAVIKDGVAKIFDWKSGKEKNEEDQLRIFCIFLALARRDVHTFISRYVWLKSDKVSDPVTLTRADLLPELKKLLGRIARYREAWDNQLWQAKTNGLCKNYCEVTSCTHCGKR